jgi:site-specific DNA-methyltransferase (adenine-specific)
VLIELLMKLIELNSNKGETIIDCFAGSGTTAVACIITKRNFIGIEISEEYVKIAERRINENL